MSRFPKESLESTLRFVLENPHSDFYRRRLGDISAVLPLTRERWESLTATPREDITPTTLWERTFVPRESSHILQSIAVVSRFFKA